MQNTDLFTSPNSEEYFNFNHMGMGTQNIVVDVEFNFLAIIDVVLGTSERTACIPCYLSGKLSLSIICIRTVPQILTVLHRVFFPSLDSTSPVARGFFADTAIYLAASL